MTATITRDDRVTVTPNEWKGGDIRVAGVDGMVRTTVDDGQLTVRVFDGGVVESWHAAFSRVDGAAWDAVVATINAALTSFGVAGATCSHCGVSSALLAERGECPNCGKRLPSPEDNKKQSP